MESFLARFVALWTRARLEPADSGARLRDSAAPVCYVLERQSAVDLAVLHKLCAEAKLPRPRRRVLAGLATSPRAAFALERPVGFWRTRLDRRVPAELSALVEALRADPALDVALVPCGIYWGRAPQKERSWLRLWLSEDWAFGSRLRRAFTVLVNGRNIWVQLGDPVSLRGLLGAEADAAAAPRRVARALRGQLARARAARIGPDLSHRRTIVASVLRSRAVRAAVAQGVRDRPGTSRRDGLLEARRYIDEIAANYSHRFVSFASPLLTRLWNRLYDGVEFTHVETLRQVADGNEIVYVPCHRSHMDYLLLSYAIYQHGFAVPHVAAGVNLNMPVVGRFLRKGGAFFMRRSFRGNSLYTIVFTEYLAAIMARGHSIEYFIEGGRSRSGRLLLPATGMLSMTVRSFLRQPRRPVVFVPVYFGYERIWEGATYIGELSGRPKEKESVGGLLRNLHRLRERFGRVHVNLGEPIFLEQLLERHAPDWRAYTGDRAERPRWIGPLVDELARGIMRNINSAASMTPVSLLALALLSTPRQMALRTGLLRQLDTLLAVLRAMPYSDRVTLTGLEPAAIVDYGLNLQLVSAETHLAGEFVRMSPDNAVLATYYRNNVLHLVALPSLVACCFLANAELRLADIQRFARRVYPYIAAELSLRWREEEVPGVILQVLAALAQVGLLEPAGGGSDGAAGEERWRRPAPNSAAAMELSLLAQATLPTIERYYLAIALLVRAGSGSYSQKALEQQCQLMAQRMTLLHGFNSPEFFDRALFGSFITLLRSRGVLRLDAQGCLAFDQVLVAVARDAEVVLSEQIRHSILQVTHD
jgi:glycerol-3-phosphate O-acyltransferase